jgi:ketosteroid isomerase-like protein
VHGQGSLVYEVARWSASGPKSDGKKAKFSGILINVFQQEADGEWKSLSHVWNASTE